MMGPTHRSGGVLAALGAFTLLEMNGLLIANVHPLLQLLVIYPFAIWGSTASDLDHHAGSIPSRDIISLAINRILHLTTGLRKRWVGRKGVLYGLLGIFDSKHRAWQTHSDFTLIAIIFAIVHLTGVPGSGSLTPDQLIIRLVLTGVAAGLVAHLVLDGITPEGIWVISFVLLNKLFRKKILPEKVGLVPRKPVYVRKRGIFWVYVPKRYVERLRGKTEIVSYFATGGPWEKFISRLLLLATLFLAGRIIWQILAPLLEGAGIL